MILPDKLDKLILDCIADIYKNLEEPKEFNSDSLSNIDKNIQNIKCDQSCRISKYKLDNIVDIYYNSEDLSLDQKSFFNINIENYKSKLTILR